MKYEYNGNLLEEERIEQVANEIVDKYPQVTIEKAKEVAMLEGRIADDLTIDDKLNRLYNIMLVNKDDFNVLSNVCIDYIELVNETNLDDSNVYYRLAEGIEQYFRGIIEFPVISDYIE